MKVYLIIQMPIIIYVLYIKQTMIPKLALSSETSSSRGDKGTVIWIEAI